MSSIKNTQKVLFDKRNTYKTAYHRVQYPEPMRSSPTITFEKSTNIAPVKEILKDVHTMSQWKTQVPFSLWHRPKDIVRNNPNQRLNPYVFQMESTEEERKRVQKTRPRLLITPACSLDDLKDEERQNIINNLYTTTTERFLRSAVPEQDNFVCPLPGTFAEPRPVKLHTSGDLIVSPEWREEAVLWDGRQIRGHSDTTKKFWLDRPAPKCTACDEFAVARAHRQAKIL